MGITDKLKIQPGDRVQHDVFGPGRVLGVADGKVHISLDSGETKTFPAGHPTLTLLEKATEMPIETFGPGQEEQFRTWERSNTGGFFLNCKAPGVTMIHRVGCLHFTGFEVIEVSFVNNEKVCSRDPDRLRHWAIQRGSSVETCSDC